MSLCNEVTLQKVVLTVTVLLLLFCYRSGISQENYRPGKLIVAFNEESIPEEITFSRDGIAVTGISSFDNLNSAFVCYEFEKLYKGPWPLVRGIFVLSFAIEMNLEILISAYSADSNFRYVELDQLAEPTWIPNDPGMDSTYSDTCISQWAHYKMQSTLAWDYERGNKIIEIIDSGLAWRWYEEDENGHVEVIDRVWINEGEDRNNNGQFENWSIGDDGDEDGIDNDGNGYFDDVIGWDVEDYPDDNDPMYDE